MNDKNKFSYKHILEVHLKYIDYLISKTHLSHQSFSNISLSGAEVEREVRNLFKNIIPQRFRVTHGYIIYASDNISEPKISKQVDLIIVDSLVANSIFTLDKTDGIEVVPVESVVGVFEIKRTLNKESISSAVNHLKNIIESTLISKKDETRYLPGGIKLDKGLNGGFYTNPIIGVLGLDYENLSNEHDSASELFKLADIANADIIASLSGMMVCTSEDPDKIEKPSFFIRNVDKEANQTPYIFMNNENVKQSSALARIFGYIIAYLSISCGRQPNINNYFFNQTNWDMIQAIDKEKDK